MRQPTTCEEPLAWRGLAADQGAGGIPNRGLRGVERDERQSARMRSKGKSVLIALLVMSALAAVASASALAHEYRIEGAPVTTSTPFEGTTGVSKITIKLGTTHLSFECKSGTVSGTLGTAGTAQTQPILKECTSPPTQACYTTSTLHFESLPNSLVTGTTTPLEVNFKGGEGAGNPWIAFTLEGCSLEGIYKIFGEQTCTAPSIETEATEHELVCLAAGSRLRLGEGPFTFESTFKLHLKSGKKWSGKS
jgi:hypothetical protein